MPLSNAEFKAVGVAAAKAGQAKGRLLRGLLLGGGRQSTRVKC